MMAFFKSNDSLKELKWWDVVVISVILFGKATWMSTQIFLSSGQSATAELPEFTSAANWSALADQVPLLLLAFVYLWWRRFDFSRWQMSINLKSLGVGVLIFIGVAILFDLYFMLAYALFPQAATSATAEATATVATTLHPFLAALSRIDMSLFIYALVNGFYEEIFFLGVCLSVEPKHRTVIFLYSLLVRYAFHTYQGTIPALAIGLLLGISFYLLYTRQKEKNLVPFFVAHAIGDLIGVGLLSYFI